VTFAHTHARTNKTRKALKFGAIMEKTPNSNAPALRLVNGPAGRDYFGYIISFYLLYVTLDPLNNLAGLLSTFFVHFVATYGFQMPP
jgi:hypothetical protein